MHKGKTYTVSQAREKFADVFNEVIFSGKPTVITKRGGKSVAVVPYDLLQTLVQLEALIDIEKANKALNEYRSEGGTTLSSLKKELGLDED